MTASSLRALAAATHASRQLVLGGHLVHALELGAFVLAVTTALVWPVQSEEVRQDRQQSDRAPTADRTWLQGAALGLFSAAAVHLAVMPTHFRQWWLFGLFFLCAALFQVGLGVLLLVRPSGRLAAAGAAGSVAVVALWLGSRMVGIPVGPDHGAAEPFGVLDVLATTAELATAVCCVLARRAGAARPAWRWSWWGLATRLAVLVLTLGVPLTAAVSARG
jgi:hypothetical protein